MLALTCRRSLLALSLAACTTALAAIPPPPRVFFTDLISGPNAGGENNNGTILTLYGKGFGTTQGTVTVGGGAVAHYYSWGTSALAETGLQKIVVGIGAAAQTGPVVVTANGQVSNADVVFTVRAGQIYFVSTTGNDDTNDGSFANPWRTILKAKDTIAAGDIAYVKDGVQQTTEDNYGACVSMDHQGGDNSGAPGSPKAIVAYPGATVTIGLPAATAGSIERALRTPNIGIHVDHWVLAGLRFVGPLQAIDFGGDDWRIIGNDLSCPNTDGGQTGCFEASGATHIAFLGNREHDSGPGLAAIDKQYHSVYFSTDSNHIEVAWNVIENDTTFRALQFHSSPLCVPDCGAVDTTGFSQFDLRVHDNLIHDNPGDGINFATVDPSKGAVEAYNNIVYNVGTNDPQGGGGAFNCLYVAGITNTGAPGTGTVRIYGNTFANCGSNTSSNAQGGRGVITYGDNDGTGGLTLSLHNNIAYQQAGELYINGRTSNITGSNNLWFGVGDGPTAGFASSINADPKFVDAGGFDLHLQGTSPAIGAGADAQSAPVDFDGVVRLSPPSIGAYELVPSCSSPTDCTRPPPCHVAAGATCVSQDCVYPVASAGTSCTDGNACTTPDACNESGVCSSGPDTCGDGGMPDAGAGARCGCQISSDPTTWALVAACAGALLAAGWLRRRPTAQ